MIVEFRSEETLVIKPENDLEYCLLEKLNNGTVAVARTFSSSLEVTISRSTERERDGTSLLWDQAKECGMNTEDED